jgi:hypothetical protein
LSVWNHHTWELTHRVTKIEEENLSLKRQLDEEQDAPHHPHDETLCAKIIDIKNKQ